MKLMFIGADHEVTGSCHYINACGKHFLVDYGMEQGANIYENAELPVEPPLIDYVFITHAHVDHTGFLPLLYSRGFRGQIFMTEASADLCSIMLRDCAHIQMQEAEWKSRKAKRSSEVKYQEPIYTMEDADGTIKRIVPCKYGEEIEIAEGIKVRFTDIGHLLGSASIEFWLTEGEEARKIVFSGDIGNKNQPLLKDPIFTSEADYVVMESTYGDRIHSAERPDYVGELSKIIQETFNRGGNVVIPSFAVGRTQEMLYFIRQIKEKKLIKGFDNFPVYVDSPLAVEATGIFMKDGLECYDEETMELVNKGINPITFPGLKLSITSDESKAINFDMTPKVILSASGMCEAGRIRHHLKHNLWRPECTILFVGYQAKTFEIVDSCKDHSERSVFLNSDAVKVFQMLLAIRNNDSSKSEFIFLNANSNDGKMHLRALDNRIRKIQHILGLTGSTPERSAHDCRRTYASIQFLHGIDIKTLQAQLGHKSAQQTWDYVKDIVDSSTRLEKLENGCIL